MGSPAIFAGKFTKLLTQKGLMNSNGSLNQYDGAKNYISYNNFENGLITGWSTFNTTLTSGLPTGTITAGSAAITTFSTTTTNPISGTYSLQAASSGAWTAGHGFISDSFTVEREDLAMPLFYEFSYEIAANATNANWSGQIDSQTFGVYIYDVTAGQWLQPSGFLGMNQITGVGNVSGSFQSSIVSGQQYRLAVIALQASSGAITINFDSFYLGQTFLNTGCPVTDFISYTPTCNWTSGYTIAGQYRRIGDSIECIVKLTCTGAPLAATETTFSIPPGLSIDTTKLLSPAQGAAPTYGDAIGYDVSVTNLYLFRCQYWTTSTVKLFYQSASTGQESAVTTSVPPSWSTSDTIIARFCVPIVGFSSSVEMSNTTDTRVIAAQYTTNAGGALTADVTNITFSTLVYDTAASWSGTVFTAPVSGYYQFQGMVNTSAAVNIDLFLWKNSIKTYMVTQNRGVTSAVHGFSGSVYLNAGQTVSLRSDTAATLAASSTNHYINVNRLSGPSVIASSESVYASYSITAAAATAVNVQFNFNNKVFDSHNSVTTGAGAWRFTAPISGKYEVSTSIINAAATNNTMVIFKNGSLFRNMGYNIVNSVTGGSIPGVTLVQLNAGEFIDVRSGSNTVTPTAGAFSGATLSNSNFIDIARVGN